MSSNKQNEENSDNFSSNRKSPYAQNSLDNLFGIYGPRAPPKDYDNIDANEKKQCIPNFGYGNRQLGSKFLGSRMGFLNNQGKGKSGRKDPLEEYKRRFGNPIQNPERLITNSNLPTVEA